MTRSAGRRHASESPVNPVCAQTPPGFWDQRAPEAIWGKILVLGGEKCCFSLDKEAERKGYVHKFNWINVDVHLV